VGAPDPPAERHVRDQRAHAHNLSGGSGLAAIAAISLALFFAAAARAQFALSTSVTSDYRYRGASLGSDQPALTVDVAYDTPVAGRLDGYFGGAVTVGQFPGAGLHVFDQAESIGVAGSAGQGATWDLGLSNTVLSEDYGQVVQNYDPEIYGGLRTHLLSCYVRYSPHYFKDGVSALYAEINGSIPVTAQWRLLAHAGALTPFAAGVAYYTTREQYDASLGVSTLFKGLGLSAAWVFQRPGYGAYSRPGVHPDALALTATWFF
jgi:hypothetical protein